MEQSTESSVILIATVRNSDGRLLNTLSLHSLAKKHQHHFRDPIVLALRIDTMPETRELQL